MSNLRFNGDKLRQLRKSKSLTLEYVANQTNVARQNISKWESGKQKPQKEKIRQVLTFLQSDIEPKTSLNLDGWYTEAFPSQEKPQDYTKAVKDDVAPNLSGESTFGERLCSVLQELRFRDEKTKQKAAILIGVLLED